MDLHCKLYAINSSERQYWRSFPWCMQPHEKRPIKRAGVAGIALRAGLCRCMAEPQQVARWRLIGSRSDSCVFIVMHAAAAL